MSIAEKIINLVIDEGTTQPVPEMIGECLVVLVVEIRGDIALVDWDGENRIRALPWRNPQAY